MSSRSGALGAKERLGRLNDDEVIVSVVGSGLVAGLVVGLLAGKAAGLGVVVFPFEEFVGREALRDEPDVEGKEGEDLEGDSGTILKRTHERSFFFQLKPHFTN